MAYRRYHAMVTTWIQVGLGIVGVLFIPVIVLLFRGAIKWTRTEDKLDHAVSEIHELVESKDKVHAAMFEQMRADREATNRRLEWLERAWMERGLKT